jgi:two-component system phosphate regulon sensor histidine kinase PhoR
MVNELLELDRIESGRVPLNLSSVSPGDILQGAVDRLRLQAEQAGLTMQLECPDDLPPILADAPRLEQVLVNLIHNAIKFTASGGNVWISAHLVDDGTVCFAVRDDGVGIPSEDLPRVFERFYKADRARSGGGTGLGLAIARHLVEAHGGRLWAESVQGQGSTFYLTIPLSN